MRVGAWQFDVLRGEPETNLERVVEGLQRAAEEELRLLVLPEMWTTSFADSKGGWPEDALQASARAVEESARVAGELGIVLVGTAPERGASGRPLNRLQVFEAGRARLVYDKVHLFSPTAEDESFEAGAEPPGTVDTAAGRLSAAVCYDLRFDELFRPSYAAQAQLLAVPAQWPDPRESHWRALVLGRAVLGQCFVVAANRTGSELTGRRRVQLDYPGNSLVVDPHGRVLAEGRGEPGLVWAEVDLDAVRRIRVRVPVAKDRRPLWYARWQADAPEA